MEGGVGAFTQELARALHDLRQEVHILTSRKARPETGERRHYGRLPEPVDIGFAQLSAHFDRWRWPSVARIADMTLRYEYDVVNIEYQAAAFNINSPAINLLPWRLKHLTRTIVTFHDLRAPYLFPKAGRWREQAIRFMARQSAGVIATNTADADQLRSTIETPVATVPIGSNITVYHANHIEIAEARELLHLEPGAILLGYFGFVNESKGADVLVEALALLPTAYHLVFIGGQTGDSDPSNEAFVAHVRDLITERELDKRVTWTGFLPDERVSTFLQAADLIVMPYRDGVSLRRGTLMAALAHGCPLLSTTPDSPVPELRHGHSIWLVPSGDVAALAESIETVAADAALRQTLGDNAAKTAGRFSWEEIAQQTLEFYQSFANPREKGVF